MWGRPQGWRRGSGGLLTLGTPGRWHQDPARPPGWGDKGGEQGTLCRGGRGRLLVLHFQGGRSLTGALIRAGSPKTLVLPQPRPWADTLVGCAPGFLLRGNVPECASPETAVTSPALRGVGGHALQCPVQRERNSARRDVLAVGKARVRLVFSHSVRLTT